MDISDGHLLTTLALRSFTLESGQEEIERVNRRRKEAGSPRDPSDLSESRRESVDSVRSPSSSQAQRAPLLGDVPEETFAIGDDEDEDEEDYHRPTQAVVSSPTSMTSRASSISESVDDAVPTQLRGMSEKARGKLPGMCFVSLLY